MPKYKLVKRANPRDKEAPTKWYATTKSEKPLEGKTMTRAATANTTVAPIEMEAALDLLAKFIPQQLRQGHTVKVPGLGTFRLTWKSEGVENIDDFKTNMIKDARIVFTAAKEFRDSVLNQLTFEEAGVLDGDINYASLSDYRLAKKGSSGDDDDDRPVIE